MSPGLLRARAPYRWKNAISGLILGAFCVGIYAYSISAVKQDVFDDVDEEARQLRESGVVLTSLEDQERDSKKAATGANGNGSILEKLVHEPKDSTRDNSRSTMPVPRGILAPFLDKQYPTLLDPAQKTLVWGAPPVDDIGSMMDSSEPAN